MPHDLVNFFFDVDEIGPMVPGPVTMRFAWYVLQRCLHGRQQIRLRWYVTHWNFEPENKYAATLKRLVQAYPLQRRCLRISPIDSTWLSEQARTVPGMSHEIIRWTSKLNYWLKQELPDLDQSDFAGLYEAELEV